MATATNLYEYYTGLGQTLPSLTERSKLYEQYGLGSATTYGGTATQNTALLGKLQTPTGGGTTTSAEQAGDVRTSPTTGLKEWYTGKEWKAQDITGGGGGLVIPPSGGGTPPSIDNSQGATDAMQTYLDEMMKQAKEQQAQLATQQTQQQSWFDKITGANAPTTADTMQQYTDIQNTLYPTRAADLAELKSLQESYDAMSAAKDQMLLNAENMQVPMYVIEGKQSQINKQMNLELNAKAAQINTKTAFMTLQDGQVDKAIGFMNDSIKNYLSEQTLELQKFGQFYDMNKDLMTSLDTKYQDMFNLAYQEKKDEVAQKQKDAEYIRDLVTQYPEANWPKDSSLWNLTPDQAAQIAGNRPITTTTTVTGGGIEETNIEQQLSVSRGTDGYVDPGVYSNLKMTSKMGPSEFDNRYGNLLSPQERVNLNIGGVADKIISTKEKAIDQAFTNKEDPNKIETEINGSNLSSEMKNILINYLWTVFPKDQTNKHWYEFWK